MRTTKSGGALYLSIPSCSSLGLPIYHEIDVISVFNFNKWEWKDSHPYY